MLQQRHEMYRPIHKALRHMLYTTSRSFVISDSRNDGVARASSLPWIIRRGQASSATSFPTSFKVVYAKIDVRGSNSTPAELPENLFVRYRIYLILSASHQTIHTNMRRLAQKVDDAMGSF